jgi:hypothetical protein
MAIMNESRFEYEDFHELDNMGTREPTVMDDKK